jgi:hypothetical protein
LDHIGRNSSGGIITTSLLVNALEGRTLGIPEDTSVTFRDCSSLMRPYHGSNIDNDVQKKMLTADLLVFIVWLRVVL